MIVDDNFFGIFPALKGWCGGGVLTLRPPHLILNPVYRMSLYPISFIDYLLLDLLCNVHHLAGISDRKFSILNASKIFSRFGNSCSFGLEKLTSRRCQAAI